MTVVIDTPAGIAHVRLAAVVSALSLELQGLQRSRGSIYHVIRRDYIDGLPARATLQNKCLAMATFLENLPDGPVVQRARTVLAETLAKNGWQINR